MGLKHDCFFCTLSIVRYSDRNVKNMFHIAKCCYVSACGCFTFMSCYRFIYHKSLHINVYRDLSQPSAGFFVWRGCPVVQSFINGMDAAINYKRSLAQIAVNMFGYEVLKKHEITFEGITKTGHRINIPITEDMLNVPN